MHSRQSEPERYIAGLEAALDQVTRERDELRAKYDEAHAVNLSSAVIIGEFTQHDSWRCEHAPHFYMATLPDEAKNNPDWCACGLLQSLAEAGINPAPWRCSPEAEATEPNKDT